MKSSYYAPMLLWAGFAALASPVASASDDELAGLLVGAGAGAVIGHAIGGHDAAVVGGFLGAAIGVAAADDDDRDGYRRYHPRPDVRYRPAPPRYYAPPYYGKVRIIAPGWRHDRGDWHHHGRSHDHDRDGWRDGRGGRDDGWNRHHER
jgi:hypothetical protein